MHYFVDEGDTSEEETGYVRMVGAGAPLAQGMDFSIGDPYWILCDSGADEDCCPPHFALVCPIQPCKDFLFDVQTQGIQINAQAELSFISNENEERSVKLSRKTHRTIPLPKGIMTQSIHSIIKNDTLILTIPLTA